jgi:hypothetical protein
MNPGVNVKPSGFLLLRPTRRFSTGGADHVVSQFVRATSTRDPAGALQWASSIVEPELRGVPIEQLANRWLKAAPPPRVTTNSDQLAPAARHRRKVHLAGALLRFPRALGCRRRQWGPEGTPCRGTTSSSPCLRQRSNVLQNMKAVLLVACFAIVMPLGAKENDTEELLRTGVTTIEQIWTKWMGKPKLEYTPITAKSLPRLHGTWKGSYIEDDEKKKDMQVILKSDGTWNSSAFRPDMKNGHWYLSSGMILLFESKVSANADLASALTLNEGKLRLLHADAKAGFVELTKAE